LGGLDWAHFPADERSVFSGHLALILIVTGASSVEDDTTTSRRVTMFFKQASRFEVQDWITPPHVEVVKVDAPSERQQQLTERVNELKKAMGPRYLCHEKNRVRRLDGRSYRPRDVSRSRVRAVEYAA
jgi:hypothetical protein